MPSHCTEAAGYTNKCQSNACRYYRAQQTGKDWKENGVVDYNALAELKEDSQRQVSGSGNFCSMMPPGKGPIPCIQYLHSIPCIPMPYTMLSDTYSKHRCSLLFYMEAGAPL